MGPNRLKIKNGKTGHMTAPIWGHFFVLRLRLDMTYLLYTKFEDYIASATERF